MAVRGRKPKAAHLRIVTGNPGKRPIPGVGGATSPDIPVRDAPLRPHKKLTKAQQALWNRFINSAWWLTDHDVPKAYVWVCLQAEYDKKPAAMVAARIAQLRVLGSELGLDQSARTRLGIYGGIGGKNKGKENKDPTEEFFT